MQFFRELGAETCLGGVNRMGIQGPLDARYVRSALKVAIYWAAIAQAPAGDVDGGAQLEL
jgi:hypothetical protein